MSLAEALAWKFHKPGTESGVEDGIRTRYNSDTKKVEIFDWPSRLGPKPTTTQINKWTTEFEALPPSEDIHVVLDKAAKAANSIAELKIVLIDAIKAFK